MCPCGGDHVHDRQCEGRVRDSYDINQLYFSNYLVATTVVSFLGAVESAGFPASAAAVAASSFAAFLTA